MKASELVLQHLHAALEAQALARKALATAWASCEEQGPDTLANALGTLRNTSGALSEAIFSLYESEISEPRLAPPADPDKRPDDRRL